MGYPFHPITQKASHPNLEIYTGTNFYPITCPSPKTPPRRLIFRPVLTVSNPSSQRTAPTGLSRAIRSPILGPFRGGPAEGPSIACPFSGGPRLTLLEPHGRWDPRDGQIHSRSLAGTGAHLSHSAPASLPGADSRPRSRA